MYLDFYNLKEKPFNVTADPNFLYLSKKHREAISHMQYGIQERMGFLEITGEIGAGKTTVCKALLNQLDQHTKTAFILNGNLSEVQLLQAIIEDFGIQVKTKNKITMLNELNKFLLEQLEHRNNAVLIIDEAQNLKPSLLEQVRLLSNLETEKEKLLQKKIKESDIYVLLERRMHCGIGVCQHCAVGGYYTCKNGPVFNYKDIKDIPGAI